MGIASKLNSGRRQTIVEGIDTKDIEYMSASDFATRKKKPDYPVSLAGFFIKNGEYGEQITLIVYDGDEPVGLNVPKRYVDMFSDLSSDEIEDIKNGKLAISKIEPDFKTPRGKTTMIEFIDV